MGIVEWEGHRIKMKGVRNRIMDALPEDYRACVYADRIQHDVPPVKGET